MLRRSRSLRRVCGRAGITCRFCSASAHANPCGDDDDHHHDPRGRREHCLCNDRNARREHRRSDRGSAGAPAGDRACPAVASACVARRLLVLARLPVSMDARALGTAPELKFSLGGASLGATGQCLQVHRGVLEIIEILSSDVGWDLPDPALQCRAGTSGRPFAPADPIGPSLLEGANLLSRPPSLTIK